MSGNSVLLQSAGFSFHFNGLAEDDSQEQNTKRPKLASPIDVVVEKESLINDTAFIPKSGSWCIVTRDYVCAGFSVRKGSVCKIDWNKSMQSSIYVTVQNKENGKKEGENGREARQDLDVEGLIPSSHIALLASVDEEKQCSHLHTAQNTRKNDVLLFYDSVFQHVRELTHSPHFCEYALDLEPGLESFVWPLTSREFLSQVYKKKAFGVLGSAQRLSQIEKMFLSFDVEALLKEATKIIVWMKTTTGEMQYLEAPSDIALSCYLAGHSLYFNPSLDLQKHFIKTLCQDLHMDFGLEKDGGFGGDLEIFAVNGAHDTPWHFDGQENFTIQLKGTKRWSLLPSEIADPLTNYHPRTSNVEGRDANFRRHRSYTLAPLEPPDTSNAQSLVLRPGSVLYVPSGMWHRVVAEDEGSLSINFSIDGARWMDVFLSRIGPLLWRQPEFRARVEVSNPLSATKHFDELLGMVRTSLGQLTGADFLPPSGFLNQRDESIIDAIWLPDTKLRVNLLCVCAPSSSSPITSSPTSISYTVSHGWSHPDSAADLSGRVLVPVNLICAVSWLSNLQNSGRNGSREFLFQELCQAVQSQNPSHELRDPLVQLCRSFLFHGFISTVVA